MRCVNVGRCQQIIVRAKFLLQPMGNVLIDRKETGAIIITLVVVIIKLVSPGLTTTMANMLPLATTTLRIDFATTVINRYWRVEQVI
jgi:hypothetical protein